MANIHGVFRTSFASIALRAVLLLTAFASLQGSAQQPAYPAKTIRLIASQAPGGGIDSVSRIVSTKLSEAVGQTVIVDNRAGANGSLAAELTAKSAPDGYTLMLGAVGNLAINTFFYSWATIRCRTSPRSRSPSPAAICSSSIPRCPHDR